MALGTVSFTPSRTPARLRGRKLRMFRAGNRVYCWGNNDSGQLGDGTHERRLRPLAVVGP